MTEKLATFRCDEDLWNAFKKKARADGSNASALLLRYVQAYLDESSSRIDNSSASLDSRIDDRLEIRLAPILSGLEELRAELGKFAA